MMRPLAWYQLREEIEDFLYFEADLLDQRRFTEWLDLLAEDLVYFMPMRRNVKFGQQAERENTRQGEGISWFDEDKWTLTKRVEQVLTGVHYAEEPLSRVAHIVSNVRLLDVRPMKVWFSYSTRFWYTRNRQPTVTSRASSTDGRTSSSRTLLTMCATRDSGSSA